MGENDSAGFGHPQQGAEQTYHELPESTTVQQLAITLSALANARGGTVLLGPDGLSDRHTATEKALQAGLLCDPPLLELPTQIAGGDDKPVLRIVVPAGLPNVYSVGDRYWIRQGKRNRSLSGRPLQQLILERTTRNPNAIPFESRPALGATLQDIDWESVREYLRSSRHKTEIDVEKLTHEELRAELIRLGCLSCHEGRYQPNHAGILLFGLQPHQYLPGHEVILVRYAGTQMGDEFLRDDLRGPLPEQIRRAEAFLISNMRKGNRIAGWQREEQTEYPPEAVREAVVNAVAHRDYSIQGDGIRVILFADRLEVYSPGRLPGHVTLENIVEERFSRNPIIVRILVDMGFIESLGYGIDRMLQLMENEGLPRPEFEETANGFRVTLRGQGEELVSVGADPSRWVHLHLNERQERALNYLTEHDRITNRTFQDLCPDVSPETIRRDLAELVRRGLLLKIGDKKATYYIFK